jgi:hypothetical protein
MSVLPITISAAGATPTPPATLRANLVAGVVATNPDYTANLPGTLIEDIASTDVYAIGTCDSALVETINSITPFGANAFVLAQLGTMLGLTPGTPTNTSVLVVFSGPAGLAIPTGFTVSDGSYQYVVQAPGGIIESAGSSAPLYAIAVLSGSWPVPSGTVNQLVTSPPPNLSPALTVSNPTSGTPSNSAETEASYRARVLQANLAASQGMPRYLKTLLMNVPGVQTQLVSVQQQIGGGWSVICGGGDPYAVAFVIWIALFDVSTLTGAVLSVVAATKANPGVIETSIDHNFATGQDVVIADSNPTQWNGSYSITVVDETHFSIGVDTSGFSTYIGSGVVTPVLRDVAVSINDYPDTYLIAYINPPQQSVALTVTWNTTSTNSVSAAAISQLATPAIVAYINSITVGQPINLLEIYAAFQGAVANVLSPQLVTRLVVSVSINGVGVSPSSGTQIIVGDPSSYFFTDAGLVTVLQG